jgi:hypothetical protein
VPESWGNKVDTIESGQDYEFDWQNPHHKSFDVGRVLDRTFTGFLAFKRPVILAMAITLLPTMLLSFWMSGQMLALGESISNSEDLVLSPEYWTISAIGSIVPLLLSLWFQLVIVQTSYANFLEKPEPEGLYLRALRHLFPMVIIAIIYIVVAILGFYALLIGFLFVWPGWALAGPVRMFDGRGIFGSLGGAWTLAKGNKRWILAILIVVSLLVGVLYSAMLAIAMTMIGTNLMSGDPMAVFGLSAGKMFFYNLSVGAIGLLIYGLFASAITACYVEIKDIKSQLPTVADVFT